MTDKGSEPVAIVLRDIDTGQNVSLEVVREFSKIATGMGLDLRLGHLLPMGGKPYVTHEGIKTLMQADSGPGISKLTYEWPHDDFKEQRFVCKCIITSRDGKMTVEGEGDAYGVPVDDLKALVAAGREEAKKHSDRRVNRYIKDQVRDYTIKNVSSQVAINLASRRMAQTRAYNRAARMMLRISLPTVEEMTYEDESIEGSVTELATADQVAKIMEFHKSAKEGIKKLFEQYLEFGKPETWERNVAAEFIERAIAVADVEVHRAKKDETKDPVIGGQAVFRQGDKK